MYKQIDISRRHVQKKRRKNVNIGDIYLIFE